MNLFNLLTSSTFILFAFIRFAATSVPKPTCVTDLETKMPIYTAVYNHNGQDTQKLLAFLDSHPGDLDLDLCPYKRSALHRAIELMDPDLVHWLIKKGAKFEYGIHNNELLPARERASNPPHLVGHLEEYFRSEKEAEAIAILYILKNVAGLNIDKWPVKDKAFLELSQKVK